MLYLEIYCKGVLIFHWVKLPHQTQKIRVLGTVDIWLPDSHVPQWKAIGERELTFVIDLAVAVDVSLANHLVDLFIGQLLSQICHHVTQLRRTDKPVTVLVKHLQLEKMFRRRKSQVHSVR